MKPIPGFLISNLKLNKLDRAFLSKNKNSNIRTDNLQILSQES